MSRQEDQYKFDCEQSDIDAAADADAKHVEARFEAAGYTVEVVTYPSLSLRDIAMTIENIAKHPPAHRVSKLVALFCEATGQHWQATGMFATRDGARVSLQKIPS